MNVQIYLDDQLAFEQNGIGWNTEPVEVNLNVTNVKTMKIRVVGREGYLCVVDDNLKAHTPGEWETEIEATCENAGKKVQRCTECKAICNVCNAEEVENIYTWVWVKPAVLLLLFIGVSTVIIINLKKKKGTQTISEDQRKSHRKKKREKRTDEDDIFNSYH